MLLKEGARLGVSTVKKKGTLPKIARSQRTSAPSASSLVEDIAETAETIPLLIHTMETTDGQKEKDPFAAMRGISFDAIKAYFYNMKETESLKDKTN